MAIFLALITALGHALDNFFVRKGLLESSAPMAAAYITLTMNFVFFGILSLIVLPGHLFKWEFIYLFVIAGTLAPALGRALNYKGLQTLGMSISIPIVNSDSVFAVTMALIFLHEPLSFLLVVGFLGVMAGVFLLSSESGRQNKAAVQHKIRARYIFYPMAAAICFGFSVFLRKVGLRIIDSPVLGATVTSGTSWLIFSLFMVAGGKMGGMGQVKKRALIYFLIAGGLSCATWLAYFQALNIGKVSIVSPIGGCYSLFTLILSGTLLRGAERISVKIVLATFLIVGGVVTLSLAR